MAFDDLPNNEVSQPKDHGGPKLEEAETTFDRLHFKTATADSFDLEHLHELVYSQRFDKFGRAIKKSSISMTMSSPASADKQNVMVAVMGVTGAGKSTFIEQLTKDTGADLGIWSLQIPYMIAEFQLTLNRVQ